MLYLFIPEKLYCPSQWEFEFIIKKHFIIEGVLSFDDDLLIKKEHKCPPENCHK